jgi:ATP-binding cassette, subfamily B, multidrug efflux pump
MHRPLMDSQKKKFDFQLFRKVMALIAPFRKVFILAAVLAVILAPLATLRPKLIQTMVDDHVLTGDVPGMQRLTILIFSALLLEVILKYFFIYHADFLGQKIIKELRVRLFRHITNLKLSFFDRTPIGQNITRTISDVEAINTIFSEGSITIFADLLTLLCVLAMMFWTSWKLTFVVLSVFPLLIYGSYQFKEGVRKSYEQVRTQIATMNTFLQERISGMKVVQVFASERVQADRFKAINRDYTSANLRAILYYAIFFPVVDIISALSLGLLVWFGARGVFMETVSMGTLISFPLFISMLYRPIRQLADKFNTLQMGLIAAERVFGLLDRDETIANNGTLKPERLDGAVVFDQVDFSYIEGQPILKQVSFELPPQQTLAIVGSTGSGKTTIISLINRFYETNGGTIRINDTDIRDMDLFALRRRIAIVLQDVFLFSGTVYQNIVLNDMSISREKVEACARMIGAHDFIAQLPGGYDFEVRERGATLSMGQRQLISFVRALVFEPDILILDEATSSIDPETEATIQFAIEKLIARRTSIIIAHRLSTIRHAHQILALDQGEVKEIGTHEALLQREGGYYRKLYEKQFVREREVV